MASLILGAGPHDTAQSERPGPKTGDYVPLGKRVTIVGRDEGVSFQLAADPRISKRHLQVRFEEADSRYYGMDMKSTNGTYVNSIRLTAQQPVALHDGDEIKIGDTTLHFTVQDFDDRQSALNYFKQVGERRKSTLIK